MSAMMQSTMVDDTATSDDRQVAFARFVLPEVDVLYRVARSITPSAEDAEDLVQDTLLRAFRSIDRFDGRHPRAWLLTILRNAAVNRTRRRRPQLLGRDETVDLRQAADDGATAETVALRGHFDADVEAAWRSLPDTFREAIELIDIAGLSYAEASEVAGVPEGTLMSRAHRGRDRIRRRLTASPEVE
jgi:RNA polymerase sigma-70 factor (ECF subfamily)